MGHQFWTDGRSFKRWLDAQDDAGRNRIPQKEVWDKDRFPDLGIPHNDDIAPYFIQEQQTQERLIRELLRRVSTLEARLNTPLTEVEPEPALERAVAAPGPGPTFTQVIVRFTREGWHRWQGAPPHREYLNTEHRHLFYFEVGLQVFEDDREVEFHELLHWSRQQVRYDGDFDTQSCEMIARDLLQKIIDRFSNPKRSAYVSVFEDNEVGAKVTYIP